jgi:hypothetical protein
MATPSGAVRARRGGPRLLAAAATLAAALVPAHALAAPACVRVDPAQTSDQIVAVYLSPRPHYACVDASVPAENRLLLFFGGTRSAATDYTLLMEEAARGGLHAVSLSYANRFAVNLEVCPFVDDPECYEQVRHEIIYGNDVFAGVEIDRSNSAIGRLRSLLLSLERTRPGEGWGQYLTAEGEPVWSKLVVSGHSQGAGHATMVARDHEVERLVIFAWGDRLRGDYSATTADALAPWLKEPFATPADRLFAFEHVRDRGVALRRVMWKVLGMTSFGPEVDVDRERPPYGGTHTLTTNVEAPRPHSAVCNDEVTPVGGDGAPVLRDVWRYLFDVPGAAPRAGS